MRILLIDDDTLELFLSLRILRMEFQAEGFKTLPEAIDWAKNNTFDLLLSDYYISNEVHAKDVLKAMIDLKGNNFKSIVLTNHVDEPTIAATKGAGFDGILEKPLSLEKLKSVVGIQ